MKIEFRDPEKLLGSTYWDPRIMYKTFYISVLDKKEKKRKEDKLNFDDTV